MIKLLILLFTFNAAVFAADSVKVESKIYYARFDGINIKDTAVYQLPVITDGLNTELKSALNAYLSADSILGENIDSVVSYYRQWRSGLVGSSYNVLYNKKGTLSISVYIETLGAYPDSYYQDINLNLNTGKRILISEIIKREKMKQLAAKLDEVIQQRIKDKIKQDSLSKDDAEWMFGKSKFTVENLSSYAIKDGGIMFYYNFGLPHVAEALSPDEDIWMSNEELSEFYTEYGKTLH